VLLREKFEMGSSLVSFSLGELASPPWTEPRTHSLKKKGGGYVMRGIVMGCTQYADLAPGP
jgi:hypothetical protein